MEAYPFYEYLDSQIDENYHEVNLAGLTDFFNSIKNLSAEDANNHYEQIDMIIYYHDFLSKKKPAWENKGKKALVYGSDLINKDKGTIYNLENFPIRLQLILQNYSNLFSE